MQRDNAEIERRCQEVIDVCANYAEDNPILAIHDVGAGGLSNAVPELLNDAECGGDIDLDLIPCADPSLSPMEIWCNESQERYVLGIAPDRLRQLEQICARERCPIAAIGTVTRERHLRVHSATSGVVAVDLPMEVILGKTPKMHRIATRSTLERPAVPIDDASLSEHALNVLRFPSVADKRFLITIGDRSVSGLVVRDQMVGPWQVPVADCAVTAAGYQGSTGEAMAMGERTPVALLNGPASARLAIGEAITNIAAARILRIQDLALSANWMAACGNGTEDAQLFDTVMAVGHEFCPALGIPIPVGKDSLSMTTRWTEEAHAFEVSSPVSLIVSAFAPVPDINKSLTPQIGSHDSPSRLIYIDLGQGAYRLGGSVFAQTQSQLGNRPPDVDDPELLRRFFEIIQTLNEAGYLRAYHDRSDGGLLTTLAEMAFAGRTGIGIEITSSVTAIETLFSEELGAVIEVDESDTDYVLDALRKGTRLPSEHVQAIGAPHADKAITIRVNGAEVLDLELTHALSAWSEVSYRMKALRDDPDCARQEFEACRTINAPGLRMETSFDQNERISQPYLNLDRRPKVAILREQGVNGQLEMAAAFMRAGFEAVDVHMTDLVLGTTDLDAFHVLAACGGFSYGDVLGAGTGWARSILNSEPVLEVFSNFFTRQQTLTLGVCNGCQMLSQLREIIPGAAHFPKFSPNQSEQFEARLAQVKIEDSPSAFFRGMAGSIIPVAIAHGEGRVELSPESASALEDERLVSLRYVEATGHPTHQYPINPNGSTAGITGLTSHDGRVTILMPHPERVFLRHQLSWCDRRWQAPESPWFRMFENARLFVD